MLFTIVNYTQNQKNKNSGIPNVYSDK